MDQRCPSHEELSAFVTGRLHNDSFESVARHVGACAGCLAILNGISPRNDRLLALLHGCVGSDPVVEEPKRQMASPGCATKSLDESHSTAADGSIIPDSQEATRTLAGSAPAVEREKLGRFENLGEIKRGGMGVIYRARDPILGRTVALKMIKSAAFAGTEDIERFLMEAKSVAQLKHDNIIKIHEFGQLDGQPYFTMDLAEFGSLQDHLERFQRDPRAAVSLLAKVARAVHYVHEHKIVHRDLKPGNILLEDNDKPVVSDFGLAKWLEGDADLTQPGGTPGTAAYMAPEQFTRPDAPPRPSIDVWAIGVILYQILNGQKPFSGRNRQEYAWAIVTTEPPKPRTLKPRLPYDLETITLKCLDKNPERRYATAADLADDMERWLRFEPIKGKRLPVIVRAARWYRRHHVLSSAVILVLAAAFGMHVLLRDSEPSGNADPDFKGKELLASLHRGEKVTLIGPQGPPDWIHLIGPGSLGPLSKEGISSFQTQVRCLVDLLPPDLPDRYLFGAELQPISARGVSGIFLGRAGFPIPDGDLHAFLSLTVSHEDLNRKEKKRAWHHFKLMHFTQSRLGMPPLGECRIGAKESRKIASADKQTPWHTVVVAVTPERIRAIWNDEDSYQVTPANLKFDTQMMLMRENFGVQAFEPSQRGPFGLFLDDSICRFRNVWVQKLESSNNPELLFKGD